METAGREAKRKGVGPAILRDWRRSDQERCGAYERMVSAGCESLECDGLCGAIPPVWSHIGNQMIRRQVGSFVRFTLWPLVEPWRAESHVFSPSAAHPKASHNAPGAEALA